MGIKSFLSRFSRKENELPVQRVERPGLGLRLAPKKKSYTGKVAIVFKGKPMKQFTLTHKGYGRDAVALEIEKELTIKLISVVQDKPRRGSKYPSNEIKK